MSHWPGKFVIGLTGNIGTGKTVVRRMLEHLGAYTVDADALSHRAIAKGAPGYGPVVDLFGKWILDKNGEIDRAKLGTLVFRDPAAMQQLETIVHPLVRQAVEVLGRRATQPVVVIEAIKLLEGDLRKGCDSIWVTYAPQVVQIERLTRKRGISREEALQRIHAQAPQESKLEAADVVIRNIGSYDDLWKQVTQAWKKNIPVGTAPLPAPREVKAGEFTVTRGKPKDAGAIAGLINRLSKGEHNLTADNIMAQFGDKAYMLLDSGRRLVGIAGWQVENLVVRTTDVYVEPDIDAALALETLVREIEKVSSDLQCEASLVFFPTSLPSQDGVWKKLGYEGRSPHGLGVQAWTDAAKESMPADTRLYFKQLRQDRVLRPI
ncbi:MAG TPA: dephospho-CoA kinase [Anaerolineales bacterium]|nr:dephospho-CoA kinase [Anaerolineales bacterium]